MEDYASISTHPRLARPGSCMIVIVTTNNDPHSGSSPHPNWLKHKMSFRIVFLTARENDHDNKK